MPTERIPEIYPIMIAENQQKVNQKNTKPINNEHLENKYRYQL